MESGVLKASICFQVVNEESVIVEKCTNGGTYPGVISGYEEVDSEA